MTRTISPISNSTLGRGLSTPSCICCRIFSTSFSIDRGRLVRRTADEAGDLLRALHQVPGSSFISILDEHVAGEELALGDRLLAAAHLDDFLGRHQDLPKLSCMPDRLMRSISAPERTFRSPNRRGPHTNACSYRFQPRTRSYRTHPGMSDSHRKSAITTTNANTRPVVCVVSLRARPDNLLGFGDRFAGETDESGDPARREGAATATTGQPSLKARKAATRHEAARRHVEADYAGCQRCQRQRKFQLRPLRMNPGK